MAIQIVTTNANIILILIYAPLKSRWNNRLTIFDEYVAWLIVMTLLCFTDFIPDPETRYDVGKVYIGVFCAFTSPHLAILLGTLFLGVKKVLQNLYTTKCRKKQARKYATTKHENIILVQSSLTRPLDKIPEEDEDEDDQSQRDQLQQKPRELALQTEYDSSSEVSDRSGGLPANPNRLQLNKRPMLYSISSLSESSPSPSAKVVDELNYNQNNQNTIYGALDSQLNDESESSATARNQNNVNQSEIPVKSKTLQAISTKIRAST